MQTKIDCCNQLKMLCHILSSNLLQQPIFFFLVYEFIFRAVFCSLRIFNTLSKLRFSPAKVLRFCMHDSGGSETPLGSQSPETRATRIPQTTRDTLAGFSSSPTARDPPKVHVRRMSDQGRRNGARFDLEVNYTVGQRRHFISHVHIRHDISVRYFINPCRLTPHSVPQQIKGLN